MIRHASKRAKVCLMGEIRVKVMLVNAFDEALSRRKKLKKADVRRFEADAMVDTGAVQTVIPAWVVEKLGVLTLGKRSVVFADGRKTLVEVTEPINFELLGRSTYDEALVTGNEVLIGQTILEKLDLLADCRGQRVVANPAHPDGPVTKVK